MGDLWLTKSNQEFCTGVAKFYERVLLWNATSGNDLKDPSMIPRYQRFVDDEIQELRVAYFDEDPLEFAKELADVMVTTCYLLACESGTKSLNAQYVNSDPFTPLEFHDNVEALFRISVERTEPSDLLELLERLCATVDVDMVGVLHEVMDSNFSKFVDVHDAVTGWGGDLAPVCKMIEENSKGRYKGVTSQESHGYIVFRDETGKILKAPSYLDADVRRFIPEKWLK